MFAFLPQPSRSWSNGGGAEVSQDLYLPAQVFSDTVPPLRERPDIFPSRFGTLLRNCPEMKKRIETIPSEAMKALQPITAGNVRELENFIERAVILTPGDLVVSLAELKRTPVMSRTPDYDLNKPNANILKALRESDGSSVSVGAAPSLDEANDAPIENAEARYLSPSVITRPYPVPIMFQPRADLWHVPSSRQITLGTSFFRERHPNKITYPSIFIDIDDSVGQGLLGTRVAIQSRHECVNRRITGRIYDYGVGGDTTAVD